MAKGSYGIGDKVGSWTVKSLEFVGGPSKRRSYMCECVCGTQKPIRTYYLETGRSTCCVDCANKKLVGARAQTHGRSGSREYLAWQGMINRCRNKNLKSYHRYGGRGIKVCDRWMDFELFIEDMGERPDGYTLDRIDNDGNYTKENCRWVTHKENTRNRSPKNEFGISGVLFSHKSFKVSIGANYKNVYIGSSPDFFEACCMRKSAENKYWKGEGYERANTEACQNSVNT